jgi:hypothetical protein
MEYVMLVFGLIEAIAEGPPGISKAFLIASSVHY